MHPQIKLGFVGIGRYLPSNILTNAHLEKMVDTTDEWITQRTGIKQRRIIGPDETLISMTVEAAHEAIKNAGIDPDQISVIRIGVNTHLKFPSLASLVQHKLKVHNTSASDISAGCASFIFAVEEIFNRLNWEYISTGRKSYGLAIGTDALSSITDWNDRGTCVLFGDGAGAAVIGPVETGEILATHTRVDGKYGDLLYLDEFISNPLTDKENMTFASRNGAAYPFLRMEGPKVFVVAVRTMMADIQSVIEKYNTSQNQSLSLNDIKYVIPHQANLRIVSAVQEGLKLNEDQVYRDGVINYGNTSAATIPIGYVDVFGKHPGALSVDVSFGAGFASGAILRHEAELS